MKSNQQNAENVKILKQKPIELRKTGASATDEPVLELGLLLDCTSSMSSWIQKAKDTLKQIIDNVTEEAKEHGKLKCRVSFVGYRDIKDRSRFEVKPFDTNVDDVKNFIQT